MLFENRREAGKKLGQNLRRRQLGGNLIVLALPRGGVPVGYEVAASLGAPMDLFMVRKLGAPGVPELAMGAVATGGVCVRNESVIEEMGITEAELENSSRQAAEELSRKEKEYRGNRRASDLRGRTAILVDDGLATGSSMLASVSAAKSFQPARLVVAVPVASKEISRKLESEVDELVCLANPEPFNEVGRWYSDFVQTTDGEVRRLLERNALEQSMAARP
ncbi:MAG: phosphoribosyltransferase [Elusimicrobia bacterium]|nr:phosphoribosyltransferase [Elusimicrobiota bacterium]